ncbi:hypothetical protein [Tunicatimonas pelagia]|uniref:hypothetical protein n=1 Tax=Tunicatimonas pelagia TaxID=931531 RepID=UPI002665F198|nr:hypothetical protein [Tunicatimonas pelagia]WKN45063.1 hypothetical protein P0M28_08805 [Tunicatimonas pelagia]
MYNSLLKIILIGVGIGLVLFALPFILKIVLFVLLLGVLFRFVGRRLFWSRFARVASIRNGYYPGGYGYRGHGSRWHYPRRYTSELHPASADNIRNMTDEEYDSFRQKLAGNSSDATQRTTIEIQ